MRRKCCVVNCKGNSDEQTKVKVYRLPRNLEERKRDSLLYSGTIYQTLKTQLYVKNIRLKTILQNYTMAKKHQEILLLYLHALNRAKFQDYYHEKEVPSKH